MQRTSRHRERGASLIGYALVVSLIGITGVVGLTTVGTETSATFTSVDEGLATGGETETEPELELTPQEKWEKAKADYAEAIAQAKAARADTVAAAKAARDAAKEAAKGLPKQDRKAANQAANQAFNDAKTAAGDTYSVAVQAAKDARAQAQAEYKATK